METTEEKKREVKIKSENYSCVYDYAILYKFGISKLSISRNHISITYTRAAKIFCNFQIF